MRVSLFFVVAAVAHTCNAEDPNAIDLANVVLQDAGALASHTSLADWKQGHLYDTVRLKGFESNESLTDFAGLASRCADSVFHALPERLDRPFVNVGRTAMFLVPPVSTGKLPALPRQSDSTLVRRCTLEEILYETTANVSAEDFRNVLKSRWGEPNGAPGIPLLASLDLGPEWGARRWANITTWSREGMVVRVASGPVNSEPSRLVVWIRNNAPWSGEWEEGAQKRRGLALEDSGQELVAIARLEPELTKSVLGRTHCVNGAPPKESTAASAERLGKWLRAAKGLPPDRRAAALLVAESYMNCVDVQVECGRDRCSSEGYYDAYTAVGAVLEGCPLGGYVPYAHNFLKEAMRIGTGRAKEWADLFDFWSQQRWGQSVETGERLATRFPQFHAELEFDAAMAHELRWLLPQLTSDQLATVASAMEPFIAKWWASYLVRDPDRLSPLPGLGPGVAERELAGAIRDFTVFVQERPDDPAAVFAWQEVWRIKADLSPSKHFEGVPDCE